VGCHYLPCSLTGLTGTLSRVVFSLIIAIICRGEILFQLKKVLHSEENVSSTDDVKNPSFITELYPLH
jgi:hypothetical protein